MTNLADLLPAGGGQNNTDFVADGNISAGAPVILTSDGKAKAVSEDAQSASFGSTADYDTDRAYYPALVHDTASGNNVVIYRDSGNNNYPTARVVSVSGSTLTFGTAVVVHTVHADWISADYDASQNKILISYRDDTYSRLRAVVGTVSGTSISFGSAALIGSYGGYTTKVAYNAAANASLIAFSYAEGGGYSNYPYGCVATISGTSVSFGTLVRIESTGREMSTATNIYDPSSTKNLIIWRTGYEGRAAVATVSGTSVSFGTHVDWTTNPNSPSATYDSVNEKIAICFTNLSVSSYVYYIVATVSGTSVSFGTEAVVASEYGYEIRGSFDTSVNKHVTTYTKDAGADQYRFLVEGTMSGTTMSWTSPVSADNGNNAQYSGAQCFDPVANKSILAITDNTTTTAYMRTYTASGNITNLTSTNLLGIASGAISDTATGKINTWGSRCESVTGPSILSAGSPVTYLSAGGYYGAITYDTNSDKVVVVNRDDSSTPTGYGVAYVGTVSGTSISYGTQVVFNSGTATDYIDICFDASNNTVVVVYKDGGNSGHGTAIVGTVAGGNITFGSEVVFNAASTDACKVVYDSSNNKVVVSYRDTGNSNYGTAIVGTVSGTSISFGTAAVFDSQAIEASDGSAIAFDTSSNQAIIVYRETATYYINAVTGSVSGTSITFGTPVDISVGGGAGAYHDYPSVCYDSTANKLLFAFREASSAGAGLAKVGTVSGTAISVGTVVQFSAKAKYTSSVFDTSLNQVVISYQEYGTTTYGYLVKATISGTDVTFSTPEVWSGTTPVTYLGTVYDPDTQSIVSTFADSAASYYGKSVVAKFSTDLTISSDYYVQDDGTITTSTSGQLIGKAITTTQINIKDYTG